MSDAIASILYEQVDESDGDRIVAPGASCRTQLENGARRDRGAADADRSRGRSARVKAALYASFTRESSVRIRIQLCRRFPIGVYCVRSN